MSTYRARLAAARLSREAHVEVFGGSAQTQVQCCKARGINATTFSGWLRSARVATATITLMANAAAPRDEKNERAQHSPDAVVRADAPDGVSGTDRGGYKHGYHTHPHRAHRKRACLPDARRARAGWLGH